MKKKGNVNKLTGFALTLVVFTVVLAIGLNVLSKLKANECGTQTWDDTLGSCTNTTGGTGNLELSSSYNSTSTLITHMGTIPGWIPVVIVAMIGGIVLFLVIKQFGR